MSQTIYRNQKNCNYSVVSNEFINDPNLSAKAKGILLYLLSKPNDWIASNADIVNHMADGIDSIKSGIQELKKARYLKRSQRRDETGRIIGWETLVFESRQPEVDFPPDGKTTRRENHPTGKPQVENPPVENPPLLNTEDQLSTDLVLSTDLFKSGTAKKSKPTPQKNKPAFSGNPNQEQLDPVEPAIALPVQTPDPVLTGKGESSAAAQNQKIEYEPSGAIAFVPQHQHGTSKTDQRFQAPPWGWKPPTEFLKFIAAKHLPSTDHYKGREFPPNEGDAEAWLIKARTDEARKVRAKGLYIQWQESLAATQSRQPVIAGAMCENRESDRPDPEAARAGVALMKQALAGIRGQKHGLSA